MNMNFQVRREEVESTISYKQFNIKIYKHTYTYINIYFYHYLLHQELSLKFN